MPSLTAIALSRRSILGWLVSAIALLFWLGMPPALAQSGELLTGTVPLKTYFLPVPSEGIQHRVKLDPAATRLRVLAESGNGSIQCGDSVQTYHCAAGKPLDISRSPESAVSTFTARNTSASDMRLRLEVYAVVPTESPAAIPELPPVS